MFVMNQLFLNFIYHLTFKITSMKKLILFSLSILFVITLNCGTILSQDKTTKVEKQVTKTVEKVSKEAKKNEKVVKEVKKEVKQVQKAVKEVKKGGK